MGRSHENLIERLKKIAALAERGIGGEKENAKRILARMMEKYGITSEDLGEGREVKKHVFKYKSKWEKEILFQCYCRASGKNTSSYWQMGRGIVVFKLDFFQFLELDALYNYFVPLLKREMKLFLIAFIHKHDLYSNEVSEGGGGSKLSHEEIVQLAAMMSSMKDGGYISPRRQLE